MKDHSSLKNVTYVFSHTTFLEALKDWEKEQIEQYPNQEERIQITTVAMQYFFRSQQVKDHKMIISGNPEDFVIQMPGSLEHTNDLEPTKSLESENSPESGK